MFVLPHLERVLITGASGTLGRNVVHHLSKKHPASRLFLLLRTPAPELLASYPNVEVVLVDLLNTAEMVSAVNEIQPNAIVHCASTGVRPSNIDYFDFVEMNVFATTHLFHASTQITNCHFIHVSTGLVYGSQDRPCRENDPVNTLHPYGASKAAADCLLRAGAEKFGRHLTIIRPFSFTGLYDGGDRLFPSLLRCAHLGTTFEMSPGTQHRDFCAVQDVVDAIALVLEEGDQLSREIFNVGSGLSVSLGRTVHSVVRQLGLPVKIALGARPFHPLEPAHLVADISRALSLGWQPRVNLAYAVWQLAQSDFPTLTVHKPEQYRRARYTDEAIWTS